jgi:hypothetical protein
MRAVLVTSALLASLLAPSPSVAAPATPGVALSDSAPALRGDQPACLSSATTVATRKLRIRGGGSAGKLVITLSTEPQGTYTHVVCAYTVVAKKYRKARNVVRQTFLEYGDDGTQLGTIVGDTFANKREPLIYGSSFVPAGHRYVFRATLEAGTKVSGKLVWRDPSAA